MWLAVDERLETRVAVKVLADNWAANPDIRRRFVDEARLLRRIEDERVIPVYVIDDLADGRPYFVMAWADRGTLLDRLDARAGRGFGLPEAVAIGAGIAECLAVVHSYGVVHRDIKPSNVLYRSLPAPGRPGPEERMVLADFGLAKDLISGSGFTIAAGTPAYMAPEQAGRAPRLDVRADVFAATAVFYEVLTGQPAFNAETLSAVADPSRRRARPAASLRPGISPRLQAVIERGLSPDPLDRFGSAVELAAALRATLDAAPAPPAGVVAGGPQGGFTVPRPAPPTPFAAGPGPNPPAAPSSLAAAGALVEEAARSISGAQVAAALDGARRRLRAPAQVTVAGDEATVRACLVELGALDGAVVTPVVLPPSAPGHPVPVLGGPAAPSPDRPLPTAALANADVVVAAGPAALGQLGPALAALEPDRGPVVLLAVDPPGAGSSEARSLEPAAVLDAGGGRVPGLAGRVGAELATWTSVLRATSALEALDSALSAAADQEAAGRLGEEATALRRTQPGFAELRARRAETAGRLGLSPGQRAELRRVLSSGSPAARTGSSDAAPLVEVRARAAAAAGQWRALANSGRPPFSARLAADVVARAYDRLALSGS